MEDLDENPQSYKNKLLQNYLSFFFILAGVKKFSPVTTLFPVFDSNSFRAFFATAPPFLPALALLIKPFAFSDSAICRVDNSA